MLRRDNKSPLAGVAGPEIRWALKYERNLTYHRSLL